MTSRDRFFTEVDPLNRRALARGVLRVSAAALTIASLLGLAGRWHWIFDLFANFPLYLAVALAALMIALAWIRDLRVCGLLALPLALNLVTLAPFVLSLGAPAPAADGPRLRVLHLNVLGPNPDTPRALAELATREVDLIVILELRPRWGEALRGLPGYEFVVEHSRRDNFGIGLLRRVESRARIVSKRVIVDSGHPPMIEVEVEVEVLGPDGGDELEVSLLALHPYPPASARLYEARNAQLDYAAEWAANERARGRAPVIVGDLNATPFSPVLEDFRARAGLVNSQRGHGYQGTFPATLPVPRIPIDHAFHDPRLTTTERRVGPAVGSDHLPLEFELAPAR